MLDGLAIWLADNAHLRVTVLHENFCRELVARGTSISRSSLGIEMLHPEQSGTQSVWTAEGTATLLPAFHGITTSADYLHSPAKIVDDTNELFRRRLDAPVSDIPLLEELRLGGATDYAIWPLPFLERSRSAFLSFATAEPGGFSAAQLDFLGQAARLISPYAERRALRRVAIDLLDTYVGHYAGERIFQGQILRGAVDAIEAAILMCDMRGFTALSNRTERETVIEILDGWFERIEAAVEAHDGEILKFMGDGLLAIFRADQDGADAGSRAYAAALATASSLNEFGRSWAGRGEMELGFAIGLHIGEVAYGNVGGRHRLDFTVLGPAVNYASRLQELAKRLNRPILVSQDFAKSLPDRLDDLGMHPLRGIGKAEQIYALPVGSRAEKGGAS